MATAHGKPQARHRVELPQRLGQSNGHTPEALVPKRSRMRATARFLPETVTLLLLAYLWVQTLTFREEPDGPGPAFYPRTLIALLAIALLVQIGQKLRTLRAGRPTGSGAGGEAGSSPSEALDQDSTGRSEDDSATSEAPPIAARQVVTALALVAAYVLGTVFLGWPIATVLFVIVFLHAAGTRQLWKTIPLALLVSLAFSFVFLKYVYISLPTGVGFFDDFTVNLLSLLGIY